MRSYEENRGWADQYTMQMRAILGTQFIVPSSWKEDVKQATDLKTGTIVVRVGSRAGLPVTAFAMRIRRSGLFWGRTFNSPVPWARQFTIRCAQEGGGQTELEKIRSGFADWFIYGHVEQDQVRHWMIVDLAVFRSRDAIAGEQQDNKDGTRFVAFDVNSYPDELIIACSDTMRLAWTEGPQAVERLPPMSTAELDRPQPPDLQALVRQCGGYDKITAIDWTRWDAQNADYQNRRRLVER